MLLQHGSRFGLSTRSSLDPAFAQAIFSSEASHRPKAAIAFGSPLVTKAYICNISHCGIAKRG